MRVNPVCLTAQNVLEALNLQWKVKTALTSPKVFHDSKIPELVASIPTELCQN